MQRKKCFRKSARGSRAKELLFMPNTLVAWLLRIIAEIEIWSFAWPKSLMVAGVVMLGRTHEQPACPLKTRPTTITSRIYRNWTRRRSLQVTQHLQSLLPAQVAGAAAGVSADIGRKGFLLKWSRRFSRANPNLELLLIW